VRMPTWVLAFASSAAPDFVTTASAAAPRRFSSWTASAPSRSAAATLRS
jgi:hypothetical protein